jgi:DNA-binding NtrC family response regulator
VDEKILIADDEENIRFLYEEELRDEGYQTVLAKNGRECLEKLKEESPDLIILDIRMPKMDGLEAIGHIIELNKSAAVIINTAYPDYKNKDYMSWAADAYVEKSSDLDNLKTAIKNVLAKKKTPATEILFPIEENVLCNTETV